MQTRRAYKDVEGGVKGRKTRVLTRSRLSAPSRCLARPPPLCLTMPHDPPMSTPPSTSAGRTHVFVTVGSTRFDALVQRVLSEPVQNALWKKGYRTMDVQCGSSDLDITQLIELADGHWRLPGALETNVWRFKPTLSEDYGRAGLIISHAGRSPSPRASWMTPTVLPLPRLRNHPRRSQARKAPRRRPQSLPPRQPPGGAFRLASVPESPQVHHRWVWLSPSPFVLPGTHVDNPSCTEICQTQ